MRRKGSTSRRITVRLPESLHREAKALADRENAVLNELIIEAVRQFIATDNRERIDTEFREEGAQRFQR